MSGELFQSTHPRGVRLVRLASICKVFLVSIHAPAWGATSGFAVWKKSRTSFNPRTRVGCDAAAFGGLFELGGFNPRTRVGCDARLHCVGSVHGGRFQSTHPRGVRPVVSYCWFDCYERFQSTHPRGVRRACTCTVSNATSAFQSTHPRGVRLSSDVTFNRYLDVSIHAPAWGATPPWNRRTLCRSSFNPRTRVGCDAPNGRNSMTVRVSIHAPAWGATGTNRVITAGSSLFQSTHPRGVRLFPCFIQ